MPSDTPPTKTLDLIKEFARFLVQRGLISAGELENLKQQQQQGHQSFLKLLIKYPFAQNQEAIQNWALRLAEMDILQRGGLLKAEYIQSIFKTPPSSSEQSIVTLCLKKGWLEEKQIKDYIRQLLTSDYNQLTHQRLYPSVLEIIPPKLAVRYQAIPVFLVSQHLVVAMVHPDNLMSVDDLNKITRLKVHPVAITADTFQRLVQAIVFDRDVENTLEEEMQESLEKAISSPAIIEEEGMTETQDVEHLDSSAVLIVNRILSMAISQDVSDIHIEATQDETIVRFRKDGILSQVLTLPTDKHPQVIARIKILSSLDVSEKRLPLDGRMRYQTKEKTIDFRVSTALSRYGETVVMRLIDRAKATIPMSQLGIPENEYQMLNKMLTSTKGLIFITGPTGSGKTTTLYASLHQLANPSLKLISVEDPIEYDLPGIVQMPVHPKIGVTFARLLRTILRQDPDIVMIGETRDQETAAIAIEAALTGHLVLTSLHTNDAVGTITRLIEMGIEPFLISSVMLGAIGQRLVRRICDACKQPFEPPPELLQQLKMEHLIGQKVVFSNPGGCPACDHSGYKGRIGIYEVFLLNDKVREMIIKDSPESLIREEAIKSCQLRPLQEQAADLLKEGKTSLEAVSPILMDASDSPMIHCPKCQERISKEYDKCPFCSHVLQNKCPQCKVLIESGWSNCPKCGCLLKGEQIFTTFQLKKKEG